MTRPLRLVQVAVPSRTGVEAYQEFRGLVDGLVGRINGDFGTPRWVPVHYIYRGLPIEEVVRGIGLAQGVTGTVKPTVRIFKGIPFAGVSQDEDDFIPVDATCRVQGLEDVFAVVFHLDLRPDARDAPVLADDAVLDVVRPSAKRGVTPPTATRPWRDSRRVGSRSLESRTSSPSSHRATYGWRSSGIPRTTRSH